MEALLNWRDADGRGLHDEYGPLVVQEAFTECGAWVQRVRVAGSRDRIAYYVPDTGNVHDSLCDALDESRDAWGVLCGR